MKRGLLQVSRQVGISALVLGSTWRKQRLLIVGYHGISQDNEHQWNPSLYMDPRYFRRRLQLLRKTNCCVLPLGEAIRRLQAGTLPERSVALTFDDGFYDFYSVAQPLLREFAFPATLFLSTYYADYNRPVFDSMCAYLLWMGSGKDLRFPQISPDAIHLNGRGQVEARRLLSRWAVRHAYSGREKDSLLKLLAHELKIDYELLCSRRILHLITTEEAGELAHQGVELQMHTHRHRVSMQREVFLGELRRNRERIANMSGRTPSHFCYPGGVHRPEFLPWLREMNISVATTTDPGLASRDSEPLLLPRFIDSSTLSESEFAGWLSGVASLLPRRGEIADDDGFFLSETAESELADWAP